jgi:hypothetical protein
MVPLTELLQSEFLLLFVLFPLRVVARIFFMPRLLTDTFLYLHITDLFRKPSGQYLGLICDESLTC